MRISVLAFVGMLVLYGCTSAKLESRLEANPQCKDVYNPKTGAVMPCPGSDQSFYIAAGLEQPKKKGGSLMMQAPTASTLSEVSPQPAASQGTMPAKSVSSSSASQAECKPKIHQKTGGTLPCPPAD